MTESNDASLLLATNNAGKVREFRAILAGSGWRLVTPGEIGLDLDPEETGTTYAENAAIKARAFAGASGLLSLADDSGLEVDALGGAPGVYSARYGGTATTHEVKARLILEAMAGVPNPARTARFRAVCALAAPDGRLWYGEGVVEGRIVGQPRGAGGFGYDPIFSADGVRTLAELTAAEKDAISHRARAAAALLPRLTALAAGMRTTP